MRITWSNNVIKYIDAISLELLESLNSIEIKKYLNKNDA